MNNGEAFRVNSETTYNNCVNWLKANYSNKRDIEVWVKPWKKKRSLTQNALSWVIYEQINKFMNAYLDQHATVEDTHDYVLAQRYGWIEVKVGSQIKLKPGET